MNIPEPQDFFNLLSFEVGEPQQGDILISEPLLLDDNFQRSVILLTEHNTAGSVGLILNKPTSRALNTVLEEFPEVGNRLYFGGPVESSNLYFIHQYGKLIPDSIKITPGLFWGGDFEILKSLLHTGQADPSRVQFFAGYSGWAPDQLATELDEKSWIISRFDANTFDAIKDEDYWKRSLRAKGRKFEIMADFPSDPGLN